MYDRYQKAREGLNIEEAMVIKKSALDVTGFAKLLRIVYIDENAAGDGYAVCLRHFLCAAGSGILFLLRRIRIYSYSSLLRMVESVAEQNYLCYNEKRVLIDGERKYGIGYTGLL